MSGRWIRIPEATDNPFQNERLCTRLATASIHRMDNSFSLITSLTELVIVRRWRDTWRNVATTVKRPSIDDLALDLDRNRIKSRSRSSSTPREQEGSRCYGCCVSFVQWRMITNDPRWLEPRGRSCEPYATAEEIYPLKNDVITRRGCCIVLSSRPSRNAWSKIASARSGNQFISNFYLTPFKLGHIRIQIGSIKI